MVKTFCYSAVTFLLAIGASQTANCETLLIKAARYLDVDAGRLVSPAILLIRDGVIAEVNPAIEPIVDQVIDLGQLTLSPGLIDVHTHLTLDLAADGQANALEMTESDFALLAAANARKTLDAGFTTIRDLGAPAFVDVAVARAIRNGIAVGPDVIAAGHAVGITGGHCDVTGLAPGILEGGIQAGIGDGPFELIKAVRYQIKHGAQVIKICATSGVLSNEATVGAQQTSAEELTAAVEEAHRHGLKIAAHAVGEAGIIAAANAGVDSIEHASMLGPEAIKAIKANGTYVVPTLYLLNAVNPQSLPPKMRKKGELVREYAFSSFAAALKSDLKIAFGTDAGVFPHGQNARELSTRVTFGQLPIEAIRGATIYASDLLGLPDRGRIRVGMRADLIAITGDPIADVSRFQDVRFVMKAGVKYK